MGYQINLPTLPVPLEAARGVPASRTYRREKLNLLESSLSLETLSTTLLIFYAVAKTFHPVFNILTYALCFTLEKYIFDGSEGIR